MRHFFLRFLRAFVFAAPLAALFAGASFAQSSTRNADNWSRYLAAPDLFQVIAENERIQIIDIRKEKDLAKGTVPGAVWVPFPEWRGPSERPGQPPTEEELEALLGGNGISLDDPIVVYNQTGRTVQTGRAAIVYWLLKSAGAEEVAILDGGFKGWQEANLPEGVAPIERPERTVDVTYRRDWWAGTIDVYAVATGQVEGAILDARLDGQVRKSIETGQPMMSMPMAEFIPASLFMNPLSERSLTQEGQLGFQEELTSRGIKVGDEFLISVCQTGELSALSWFYASEIVGIENVRYYPDAIKGWQGDGGILFGLRATE